MSEKHRSKCPATARGEKWYVLVNYRGQRKAKCVGTGQAAEEVRRQLEAQLALGDLGFFKEAGKPVPTFKDFAEGWLDTHAEVECKPSTKRSYEQLLRLHVTPRFGNQKLTGIRREEVKQFLAQLTQATKEGDNGPVPKYARNTLRLIVCALRCVLNAAIEDGWIESNPAAKLGRFTKSDKPAHQAAAMTRQETENFLGAVREICPDWYAFFLAGLRAGLRKGELVALMWGDIQFGENAEDSNRYILVQRNYSQGRFTSPKSKKSRRVDLSKQLRATLLELRDSKLLAAMLAGKSSIAEDLVFPSQAGTVIKPDNIVPRYMEPALEKAGLRRFRFHDLRHTFGSLLIQGCLTGLREGTNGSQLYPDHGRHLRATWYQGRTSHGSIGWIREQLRTNLQLGRNLRKRTRLRKPRKYLKIIGCPPGIRTPIC